LVCIGRASFTDYSKETRVIKFYTSCTGAVEINSQNTPMVIGRDNIIHVAHIQHLYNTCSTYTTLV